MLLDRNQNALGEVRQGVEYCSGQPRISPDLRAVIAVGGTLDLISLILAHSPLSLFMLHNLPSPFGMESLQSVKTTDQARKDLSEIPPEKVSEVVRRLDEKEKQACFAGMKVKLDVNQFQFKSWEAHLCPRIQRALQHSQRFFDSVLDLQYPIPPLSIMLRGR